MADTVPRDPNVITDPEDLRDALIHAIVYGTLEESQHIVDTLGERARTRGGADAHPHG